MQNIHGHFCENVHGHIFEVHGEKKNTGEKRPLKCGQKRLLSAEMVLGFSFENEFLNNLISNCINLQIVFKQISLSAYRSYKFS